MQKSICTVLLLVTIAVTVAEATQSRGRMLLQEVTYKKTETVKGSTPAVYKEESKTTGEWKVTETTEKKDKGPATFSYKKTEPEKDSETTYKSTYKGPEEAKKSYTTDKDGAKVFTYNSGKRHFEYTESSKTVKNFPATEIVYDGGKPAEWTQTKTIVGPVYEKKVSYQGSNGPSYKSEWSLDASKKSADEPAPKDGAKAPEPKPKHHRRSI